MSRPLTSHAKLLATAVCFSLVTVSVTPSGRTRERHSWNNTVQEAGAAPRAGAPEGTFPNIDEVKVRLPANKSETLDDLGGASALISREIVQKKVRLFGLAVVGVAAIIHGFQLASALSIAKQAPPIRSGSIPCTAAAVSAFRFSNNGSRSGFY